MGPGQVRDSNWALTGHYVAKKVQTVKPVQGPLPGRPRTPETKVRHTPYRPLEHRER